MIGPRNPPPGSIHKGRVMSHANLLDASSGIFPGACAAAGMPKVATHDNITAPIAPTRRHEAVVFI
jgi:hypothetical protein